MIGNRPSRRALLGTALATAAAASAGCLTQSATGPWSRELRLSVADAVQYHDPSCGCCGEYATYLEEHLEGDLEVVETDSMAERKDEVGVPSEMASCHTVVLDGLFVEGHVPVDAIEEALETSDEIAGIAVPGMPAHSPGMGEPGDEPLEVYAVSPSGDHEPFTTV
ncbi:DUF411 domain-containing protein [Natrononativus amylolyticus]|uniref:DUF411 domain-containing protein n=1 Tax=Natrononativus amylolyticus TaxID=2963434 RepID=UPI0020CBCB2E|nr:DUF411 domain-containing protein [Natrononativus amylolyticus]